MLVSDPDPAVRLVERAARRGPTVAAAEVWVTQPRDSSATAEEEMVVPEFMIAFNDEWVPHHTAEQLRDKSVSARVVIEEMVDSGVYVFSNGGIDAASVVCSVEARDGVPVFSDGPYVESKEHLGGICVVEVEDEDAARYWAGRLAVALDWPQEVHRFPGPRPDWAR